jgi:hypothetical protein
MNDEIRASRISVPRQVRKVTPEDREENDERFRKALAGMTQSEEGEGRADRKPQPAPQPPRADSPEAGAPPDDDQSKLGRNLDLRT